METWEIRFRKSFQKDFEKLNKRQKDSWSEVFAIFKSDTFDKRLRRHKLKGKYADFFSIDICPDLRALFHQENRYIRFWYIKNHNQLYN